MGDESLWYLNAVFYELNVRAFFDSNGDGHGDLRGVATKLNYLQDLEEVADFDIIKLILKSSYANQL